MPYLVCNNCCSTYKVNSKEDLNEFNTCKCGYKLKYIENYDEIPFDLFKKGKPTVMQMDNKLRNSIVFNGILLIFFGFVWSLTIVFGIYSYFVAVTSIIAGIIILIFSQNKNYNNKYLMPIYMSAGIISLLGFAMCAWVTAYSFISLNPAFFKPGGGGFYPSFPPIIQPLAMGFLSGFISLWMFATGLRKI